MPSAGGRATTISAPSKCLSSRSLGLSAEVGHGDARATPQLMLKLDTGCLLHIFYFALYILQFCILLHLRSVSLSVDIVTFFFTWNLYLNHSLWLISQLIVQLRNWISYLFIYLLLWMNRGFLWLLQYLHSTCNDGNLNVWTNNPSTIYRAIAGAHRGSTDDSVFLLPPSPLT